MAKRSKQWLQAQQRDQYVKQARQSHYRSRAVFKLRQIDQKEKLFHPGQAVIDLGAAPGSWSQYVSERINPQGRLIAVDILAMQALDKVLFIQGDVTETRVLDACRQELPNTAADLVISDMAPNLTGIRATDQARSMRLAELVYDFSCDVLKPGGDMLIKLFQGEGSDAFKKELMQRFQKVIVKKPKASRAGSREFYVLARGYEV